MRVLVVDALAEVRTEVLARCGGQCIYCGDPATEADHVLPRALGGPDELWNLWPACGRCNRSKARRTPDRWLSDLRHAAGHDWGANPWPAPVGSCVDGRRVVLDLATRAELEQCLRAGPLPPVGYAAATLAAGPFRSDEGLPAAALSLRLWARGRLTPQVTRQRAG